jgi:hypothetical protein
MIHVLVHLILLALRASESSSRRLPAPPGNEFGPQIISATTQRQFPLGYGKCFLLSNVVVEGTIYYHYVLAVHDVTGAPCLFITAESGINPSLGGSEGLSLGVYRPGGYENLGPSDSLKDMDLFQDVAVEVARTRLGLG